MENNKSMKILAFLNVFLLCVGCFASDAAPSAQPLSRDSILERVRRRNAAEERRAAERKARRDRLGEAMRREPDAKGVVPAEDAKRRNALLLEIYDADGNGRLDPREKALLAEDVIGGGRQDKSGTRSPRKEKEEERR